MKAFLVFINFSFFFQKVASMGLSVQPKTSVAQRSISLWMRQPADGTDDMDFDGGFAQGVDQNDPGLAVSAIHALPTSAQVVFPTQGAHRAIAFSGPNNDIGASNNDNTIVPLSASTTVSSVTPTSTSVSVHASATSHTSNTTRRNSKSPIIIGSILGSVILLCLLVTLIMFLIQRHRRKTAQRCSFNQDMMVQDHQPPPTVAQIFPNSSYPATIASHSQDLEQGLHTVAPPVPSMQQPSQDPEQPPSDPIIHPIALIAGPRGRRPVLSNLELNASHHTSLPRVLTGPRSPFIPQPLQSARAISPRLRSPMPRSPSPRTHRQRAIADQIEILRIQMLEFEREGGKDSSITMDEMCEKMAWLREHQEGSWALGLTEVTPPGYDRYMT